MMNSVQLARIDLNLLVLFEVIMQEQHLGRSAETLNLTPSAVSHGLGRLRRLLDDPLFLKTPKGVVPTKRAVELAPSITDILARVRSVVASVAPFDPNTSRRRFVIGAPDGTSAVFLPPLRDALLMSAPNIDIAIRQLLPNPGPTTPELAWQQALTDLEARNIDIAIIPLDDIPTRFYKRRLYGEDFVIAARNDHPYRRDSNLKRYCDMDHLVVSHTGDAHGFVDIELARKGLARRICLTVPNFTFALAMLARGDLIAALPRRFVSLHGAPFGVIAIEPPIVLPSFAINLVIPKAAMMDAGLSWLVQLLESIDIGATVPRRGR